MTTLVPPVIAWFALGGPQRVGSPGLGSADARVGRGDAAGLPAA